MTAEISEHIQAPSPELGSVARDIALFLDFDGTLVEIAPVPDAVTVDRRVGPALETLRGRLGGALALVSGRPVAVLDDFLEPHRFDAVGLHGAQRRLGGEMAPIATATDEVRRATKELVRFANAHVGVIVEDKRLSVALHWRLAPQLEDEAGALMQALAAEYAPALRLQRGKAVAELVPAGASKGGAITWLMQQPTYAGRKPIFIGDDVTDENGFAAVNAAGGLSIRIGAGETCARHRLASPTALRRILVAAAEGGELSLATFLQG